MISFLFFCFAGVMILSAVGVVLIPHPVYSVLSLILTFFVSGAVFIMLGAELVAMLLVLVYVGAVAVLFLFVVMMLDISMVRAKHGFVRYYPLGVVCMFLFFGCMVYLISHTRPEEVYASGEVISGGASNVFLIGLQLYTEYACAFQMSGILLLVAGVGGLILAMSNERRSLRQNAGQQLSRSSKVRLCSPGVGTGVADVD